MKKYKKIIIGSLIALSLIGLPVSASTIGFSNSLVSLWQLIGNVLSPTSNSWGLQVPGLATTTTGCLSVNSTGWISPNGSACGSGGGSSSSSKFATSTDLVGIYAASALRLGVGTAAPIAAGHFESVSSFDPPVPNSPGEFNDGSFRAWFNGDIGTYTYYSYKIIGGTKYFSTVSSSNSITINTDGDYVFLNWEAPSQGADGYRICRSYDGALGTYSGYADSAGATYSDINTGFNQGTCPVTPTIPSAYPAGYFNGLVGIGTTSPFATLSVSGNEALTGKFYDSLSSSGTNGMVLQTTGSATKWVATSTLGISAGSSGINTTITASHTILSPADATNYYFGQRLSSTPITAAGGGLLSQLDAIPVTGTVRNVTCEWGATATVASSENTTFNFILYNSSGTFISTTTISSTVNLSTATGNFSNANLGLSVTAGQQYLIELKAPTWATNPAGLYEKCDINIDSTGSVSGGTIQTGTTGQTPYYASNGNILTASSSLFLDTTSNVGIGTTSPWKKLSVSGNMVLTGGLFDSLSSAGSNGMVLQSTGSATQWVATSTLGISGGGSGSGTVNSGTTGQLPFYAANGTALTATSSLFLSTAQNFGIGSTSPTSALTVAGNAYIGTSIGVNRQPFAGYTAAFQVGASGGFLVTGSGIMGNYSNLVDADFIFNLSASGAGRKVANIGPSVAADLGLNTSNTERMTILSGGNVGIGTIAPDQLLTLSGSATAGSNLWIKNTSNAGLSSLATLNDSSTNYNQFITFGTAYAGNRFTTLTAAGLNEFSAHGVMVIGTDNANPVYFGTNNAVRGVISSTGKFGIGTTTPDSTLDVSGNLRLEGSSAFTTASISGAIIGIGCDTTTTSVDASVSSTTVFVTTPQTFPGPGLFWQSYLSAAGVVTTEVCSDVTVTPTASTYNVRIIK